MGRINIGDKITVVILGMIFSVMIFFIIYTAFAQIFTDFLIQNFDDVTNLSIITITLLFLSFIASIGVGLLICTDINKSVVLKASIMAFMINFLILILISYFSIFILYPETFTNIVGFQVVLIFPQIIIYFCIYTIGNIFYAFILIQFIYFIIFIIFLEEFFQYRKIKYKPPKYTR